MRAVMTDYKVELIDDNVSNFQVEFKGPKDSELAWVPAWGRGEGSYQVPCFQNACPMPGAPSAPQ